MALPDEIHKLKCLIELNVSHNSLTSLPEHIYKYVCMSTWRTYNVFDEVDHLSYLSLVWLVWVENNKYYNKNCTASTVTHADFWFLLHELEPESSQD